MADLNIQNVLNTIIKESELIINQSQNLLLKGGAGLQGNNFFGGNLVEKFIIDLLKRSLPGRFDVVSGYIVDHENFADHSNLKQVDCIIIDKAFPVFYKFKDMDLHIVSKESVCGIIEIKRNLHNQLGNAIDHLREVIEQARLSKNDDQQTMPFVFLSEQQNTIVSPYRNNPLIGMIALESGYENQQQFTAVAQRIEQDHSLVDFVWCLDGASLLTQRNGQICADNRRAANDSWGRISETHAWNINIKTNNDTTPEKILMRVLGFILSYLSFTTGKNVNQAYANHYYFNNNLFPNPGN